MKSDKKNNNKGEEGCDRPGKSFLLNTEKHPVILTEELESSQKTSSTVQLKKINYYEHQLGKKIRMNDEHVAL